MSNSSGGSSTVVGMLGVLFVGLKLAGVIDWSWWYVTMPFWGGLAIVCAAFCVYMAYLFIQEIGNRGKS